jgi:hypothetical protein
MEKDAIQLSEVVVTGYTTETNYDGASINIKGQILETAPIASFDQLLQGGLLAFWLTRALFRLTMKANKVMTQNSGY